MTSTRSSSSEKPSAPPTWVAIAGALVAIGGLIWGIASFFITKPEPVAKPTAPMLQQSAEATSGNAVNASGGATVSIGGPAPESPAGTSSPTPVSASQKAKTGPGGTAVNAADAARVSVKNN